MNQLRLAFITIILIALMACTPALPGPMPTPTEPPCQPSKIQKDSSGFSEIRVTMKSAGEMWALLFFEKAQALTDAKIAWKLSGNGIPAFQAENENGTVIEPIWGPEPHSGSNWQRPGSEWGTGFNFPEPGCWTITIMRGKTIGQIQLMVQDAP